MRINISSSNVELTDFLKKKIEKRTQYLFRDLARDVQSVHLRLHNEKEEGQEINTCCQIQVQTRSLPVIYAEHKSADIYVAFDAAAHRAKKYTSRRLNRFNHLLTQLKNLKTKKDRTKTLRLNKPQSHIIGGML